MNEMYEKYKESILTVLDKGWGISKNGLVFLLLLDIKNLLEDILNGVTLNNR